MEMVRYCPECDDEFRPEVTVCSDCGGDLILQEEGVGKGGAPPPGDHDYPGGHSNGAWRTALDSIPFSSLLPVRTFDALRDLEPAVLALAEVELPSRVLVQNGRFILLIRPDDLPAAQEALSASQAETGEPSPESPAQGRFDASSGRYSHCPACGHELSDEFDGTCSECGLELSTPSGPVTTPEGE